MPTDTCPPRIADSDFAAAGERDVVDAARRDADGVGDQAGQDLIAAAGRPSAPRDRLRSLPKRANQVVQRPERRRRRHVNHFVLARQPRNRRDVVQRHRRLLGDDRAEHDEAGDQQRVAIAAFGADETREADQSRPRRGRSRLSTVRAMPVRCTTCCMTRAV